MASARLSVSIKVCAGITDIADLIDIHLRLSAGLLLRLEPGPGTCSQSGVRLLIELPGPADTISRLEPFLQKPGAYVQTPSARKKSEKAWCSLDVAL